MIDGTRLQVKLREHAAKSLKNLPLVGGTISRSSDRRFGRRFVRDLQRLNDVLATTELADRYWVWAGMLLGWAREGHLLAHDRDADFAMLPEDLPRLRRAVPALRSAGFQPLGEFRSNSGHVVMLTFRCHFTQFEFYVFEQVDEEYKYFVFDGNSNPPLEVEARIPVDTTVAFDFLERTWLRHENYERELEAMYGDWRTPKKDWNYLNDDEAAVAKRVWSYPDTTWVP